MKNILFIILAAVMLVSCKDFLELKLDSDIDEGDFNTTEEELLISLTGCYNGMQGALYREWAVTELRSDNARIYARASSTSIYDQISQLDFSQITTSNYLVSEYWEGNYANIYNCNAVIRDIHVVEDAGRADHYLSEVKFIRAYHYFNMVRLWGGVFLVDRTISVEEGRTIQRSSPETIYNFIESDLKWIIEKGAIPVKYGDEDLGRVTLTAAKVLLAKLYMTRYEVGSSDYAKAIPLLEQAIAEVGDPQTAADLVPFDQIFDVNNEMNKEIIFAVRYKSGNMGIGSPFGNEFAPASSGAHVINGSGRSYNYPSTSIIEAFDYEGDEVRKDVTLAEKYYNSDSGAWVEDDNTTQCRYVKKYMSPVSTVNDGESDWPVIRVADLLLLYAEATNEVSGVTPQAVQYVNMIRERAGLDPLETRNSSNSYYFRQAIRDERRLELAFENHRWFDLLRWGIAVERITEYYGDEFIYGQLANNFRPTIVEWQTMLPIPLTVININPDLPQNTGY